MKKKKITITSVANYAGVSVTTASRVINNKEYVSPKTREKVEAAIAKLNYSPDQSARVLRGMNTKLVALIIPDILNVYYTTLAKEIERKLQEEGYTMLLGVTHDQSDLMRAYLEEISSICIDGLIYVPPPSPETSPFIRGLAQKDICIIEINRRREKDLFFGVEPDNFGAVIQAMEHLYMMGHRKIGFIVGSSQTSTGAQRLEGYRYFLSKYNIDPNPELLKIGEFSREYGELATGELLNNASEDQPTAIFSTSNRLLMGTMNVLKNEGIRVPEDLSVIAMDDAEWLEVFNPSITTVDVAIEEMASLTVDLLLRQISTNEVSETPRTYTLSTSLKIRHSCNHIQ
jgi:LacI family transcriptional regulator